MSVATVSTVSEAVRLVDEAVERIKNDADQHFPAAASIGDAVRQGDLYIQLIDDFEGVPVLYKKLDNVAYPVQLAPGTTKGSRHMLEESVGAEVFVVDLDVDTANSTDDDVVFTPQSIADMQTEMRQLAFNCVNEPENERRQWRSKTNVAMNLIQNAIEFSGPIFRLKCPATVSHPEHGNWVLPVGTYRIVFQRTVDSTAKIRRVLD